MQKSKIGKFSIFSSLDVKLKFLMSRVELIQFSVELSHVELKIWVTQLELSWKCEQLDSISIQVQNVNLKLNLMISLNTEDFKYSLLIENDISLMHCKIKRVVYKMMLNKTSKYTKYINKIMRRLVNDISE